MIIVGTQNDLPYLVNGLIGSDYNSAIINSSEINDQVITKILNAISMLNGIECN